MANPLDLIENLLRSRGSKGLAGLWDDEHEVIEAARKLRESGVRHFETLSPFPLHGIDEAMEIPRSWIPWVTFVFGLAGAAFGTWFTWWTSAVDWPLIIAGKPFWSLPAFVPIIFECTILFGALSSVGALFYICGLPKVDPPVIDPDLTSHRFAIFVPEGSGGSDTAKIEDLLRECGAKEVRQTEY